MAEAIWVAVLHVSERTRRKLAEKHGLDSDDVRSAVQCIRGLEHTWDDDAERGLRVIVLAEISGERCYVVLYPRDHPLGDEWDLGSAYPTKGR